MPKRILLFLLALILSISSVAEATEVVVYSARKEHLIKPLFELYTKETGVKITYLTAKAGQLLEKLRAEGQNTRADLLLTVDAGNLWHAAEAGLLTPITSEILTKNVPAHLRDPQNRWYGLSIRARTIVYNTEKVQPSELESYRDLGNSKWKGRLILRTSQKVYNQSLVAMMIAEDGSEQTEETVRSWVKNLAAKPFSNDTKVMESIAAGQGDLGVVNTYYYGRLMRKNPQLPLALFWPDQDKNGTHVNISGAGVTKHSQNKAEAQKLLEWLSTPVAQKIFADTNLEYPVNTAVQPHAEVLAWGSFKQNPLNLSLAGKNQREAIMIMDRAQYR